MMKSDVIISIFIGFQYVYNAPNQEIKKSRNQRYECLLAFSTYRFYVSPGIE